MHDVKAIVLAIEFQKRMTKRPCAFPLSSASSASVARNRSISSIGLTGGCRAWSATTSCISWRLPTAGPDNGNAGRRQPLLNQRHRFRRQRREGGRARGRIEATIADQVAGVGAKLIAA